MKPGTTNAIKFEAYSEQQQLICEWIVYSMGGGAIIDDFTELETNNVYALDKLKDILAWCNENGKTALEIC